MFNKKYQKTADRILNKTTITKFEQLPNELILICFDYFDFYQLYEIFSCLNQRFTKLIFHQAKIYINLNSIPNGKFLKLCLQLNQCSTKIQNYPLSIRVEDQHKFILILEEDFFTEKFSKLKSLSIANTDVSTLSRAIFNQKTKLYKSLERLRLLHNITGDRHDREQFCSVFISSKMESLKYLNLNFRPYLCECDYSVCPRDDDYVELYFDDLSRRKKSLSHLETIVIGDISDDDSHYGFLPTTTKISFYTLVEKLFPYLPRLKNLFINSLHFDEDNCQREFKALSTTGINSITQLNLKLIKIRTDPYKYTQGGQTKIQEFLQNFFMNNDSTKTTTIKTFHINNQNVFEGKL